MAFIVMSCAALTAGIDDASAQGPLEANVLDVEKPEVKEPELDVSGLRRAAAIGASVFPGVLLHGSGHYALGEKRTAWRLLAAEGAGLGLIILGASSLIVTGASDQVNAPAIWTTATGAGLFMFSWFADMYGVISADGSTGEPVRRAHSLEVGLGYGLVVNPALDGSHFSRTHLDWRTGGWIAQGDAWVGVDDSQWHAHLQGSRRFFGPRPDRDADDGSFFDAWLGYTHRRYNSFATTEFLGEAGVTGRYDLGRIGRTLDGMFVQSSLGLGYGAVRYDLDVGETKEVHSVLLAQLMFGWNLGNDPTGWSQISVYYDHRHDGLIAGSKVSGLGSGALGSVNSRLRLGLWENWGAMVEVSRGAGVGVNASILYRLGGSR